MSWTVSTSDARDESLTPSGDLDHFVAEIGTERTAHNGEPGFAGWLALYARAIVSRQIRPDPNVCALGHRDDAVVRALGERSS